MVKHYDVFDGEPDKKPFHRKAEERVAKKTGGTLTPASGAFLGHKGDVSDVSVHLSLLLDAKSTTKTVKTAGVYVTRKMLEKIDREAYERGVTPALVLSFRSIAKGVCKDWLVVPLDSIEIEE